MSPANLGLECASCGKRVDPDDCVEVVATRFQGGAPLPIGTMMHHVECFLEDEDGYVEEEEDGTTETESECGQGESEGSSGGRESPG